MSARASRSRPLLRSPSRGGSRARTHRAARSVAPARLVRDTGRYLDGKRSHSAIRWRRPRRRLPNGMGKTQSSAGHSPAGVFHKPPPGRDGAGRTGPRNARRADGENAVAGRAVVGRRFPQHALQRACGKRRTARATRPVGVSHKPCPSARMGKTRLPGGESPAGVFHNRARPRRRELHVARHREGNSRPPPARGASVRWGGFARRSRRPASRPPARRPALRPRPVARVGSAPIGTRACRCAAPGASGPAPRMACRTPRTCTSRSAAARPGAAQPRLAAHRSWNNSSSA